MKIARIPQRLAATVLLAVFLLTVQPRQSHAYVPVIVAAGALGAVVLVVGASTLYKPVSVPSNWTAGGKITTGGALARLLQEAHKSFTSYGQEVLMGNYVSAKVSMSDLASKLASAPQSIRDTYNDLSAMLLKDSTVPLVTTNMGEGTVFNAVGGYGGIYKVLAARNSVQQGNTAYSWCSNNQGDACIQWSVISPRGDGYADVSVYDIANGTVPPPTPKTADEIAAQYPTSDIPAGAISELDQMIADNANGYGISIVDSVAVDDVDSAPPFVPPLPAVNPIDTTAPVVQPGTAVSGANTTAATGRVDAAQSALAQAKADLQNYLSTHPGATSATDSTVAALEEAITAAQTAVTAAQQVAATTQAAAEETYPNASVDQLKKLNWDKLKSLSGCMNNVWPFTLITSIAGYYSVFQGEATAPIIDYQLVHGHIIHIDLAPWDTFAKIGRYVISVLLMAGCVLYIVRFWRGVA